VLFLTPNFLSRRPDKPIRGVDVFDLLLVPQMARAGVDVLVPAERTWGGRLRERWAGAGVELVLVRGARKAMVGGIAAAIRLRRRRFDALVLGNVARGLLPAATLLRGGGAVDRTVMIAHRSAQGATLRALARRPIDVIAVSEQIAAPLRGRTAGRVSVYYGLPNAEAFYPRREPRPEGDPVRFCVLGKLDNPWKRADLAIEAFRALPDSLRRRAELHLASYERPPDLGDEDIVVHGWLASEEIPALLRRMDVLVAPSQPGPETFSQALVQGMLTGLPTIVSDAPVLVEKVEDGAGIVAPGQAEITEAMRRLIERPEERDRMGKLGRETALARYVWRSDRFLSEYVLNVAAL